MRCAPACFSASTIQTKINTMSDIYNMILLMNLHLTNLSQKRRFALLIAIRHLFSSSFVSSLKSSSFISMRHSQVLPDFLVASITAKIILYIFFSLLKRKREGCGRFQELVGVPTIRHAMRCPSFFPGISSRRLFNQMYYCGYTHQITLAM